MIIPVGAAASGLDIFLRFNGILTDPLSITYVIFEPTSIPVGSGSGFKRSVGHYDARNTVIPSGFDTTQPWLITWDFTSPAGVTSTASENFTVSDSLSSAFDNLGDLKTQVKLDLNITTQYTEDELNLFIQKAVNRLNRRLEFTGTANELSIDAGTGAIIPTPDSTIQDFLVMQTECLIIKTDRRVAVGKGIRVKDGETEIDTTASFKGFKDVVDDICGELAQAVEDFLIDEVENTYNVAFQDADNIWYGNSNICENLFHNGQGDGRTRCEVSPYDSSLNVNMG